MLLPMPAVLALIAGRADALALAPTLHALAAAGLTLHTIASPEARAFAKSAGVSVDATLPASAPRDGLAEPLRALGPAAILISQQSPLLRSAHAAAAELGVPLTVLSGGGGRGLALEDFVGAAKQEIEELPPEALLRILDEPDREGWHLVDVREPDEYAEGRIPGARSSPRGFLEVRADLEHYKRDPWFEDRERPLILYCGGGHRSALAAQTLQRMGFTRVLSLAEGWTGWTERGYPVER